MEFKRKTKIQFLHLPIKIYDGLPKGYTRLEYLKCNGNGYINTHKTNITGIKIKCKFNSVINHTSVFGARKGSKNRFSLMIFDNVFHQAVVGGGPNTGAADTKIHIFNMGTQVNNVILMDGVQRSSLSGYSWGSTYESFLFSENEQGSASHQSYSQIYYCELYRSKTLVANLIPARRDSDSVLGMYDILNKTFLTGSNLIAGPEVDYEFYQKN